MLLAGGGSGNPQKAYETAVYLLHEMNAMEIYPLICSFQTDRLPAAQDIQTQAEIEKAAQFLRKECNTFM